MWSELPDWQDDILDDAYDEFEDYIPDSVADMSVTVGSLTDELDSNVNSFDNADDKELINLRVLKRNQKMKSPWSMRKIDRLW